MIIFDLDGTLALDEHRRHFLLQEEKDWQSYFWACTEDQPNIPLIRVLRTLRASGMSVGIWSGRSRSVISLTTAWLARHDLLRDVDLRLREEDDRTDDTELKRRWLYQLRAEGDNVDLAFEDRARVVAMWRDEGVFCCQVAPGDF